MDWFKMHAEAGTDPKLDALSAAEFRCWFKLLCKASKTGGVIEPMRPRILAIEVAGGDVELLAGTIEACADLDMVTTEADGALVFRNFAKRNPRFPSDRPEERAKRKAKSRADDESRAVTSNADSSHDTSRHVTSESRHVTSGHESVTTCHDLDKRREEEKRSEETREETPQPPEGVTADAVGVLSTDDLDAWDDHDDPEATPHALEEKSQGAKGVPPAAATPLPPGWLAEVWDLYPLKAKLLPAEKVWARLRPSRETVDLILANVRARIAVGEWPTDPADPRMTYVPRLDSYLADRRWTDAPPVARRQPARDAPQGNQARTLDVLRQAMAAAQEEETA